MESFCENICVKMEMDDESESYFQFYTLQSEVYNV